MQQTTAEPLPKWLTALEVFIGTAADTRTEESH